MHNSGVTIRTRSLLALTVRLVIRPLGVLDPADVVGAVVGECGATAEGPVDVLDQGKSGVPRQRPADAGVVADRAQKPEVS